jgi:AcrR family transcriptional regulator
MAISIRIQLNEQLYLRDPQDTKLGRRIIQHSILLIDEVGFEHFTFKKLADRIDSTEASVYRYFENKHLLLVYLLSWYWEWIKFLIERNTSNINDPQQALRIALHTIVDAAGPDPVVDFVDEAVLHRIVIAEAIKTYRTKMVDADNKKGFFLAYKSLCRNIATCISAVNPSYPYPRALASTLLEMSNDHVYFAQHLPSLTDITFAEGNNRQLKQLLEDFAFRILTASKSD